MARARRSRNTPFRPANPTAIEDAALEGQEHLQRLATLGTLAAGSAHEVNNLVMHLLASLDQMSSTRDHGPAVAPERWQQFSVALERAENCARRLREVARGMTDCARLNTDLRAVVKFNSIVDDALRIVDHHFKQVDTLEVELQKDIPAVVGNPTKLSQVVINLLVNAVHAIESSRDRRRRICVRSAYRDGRVELSVEDNGCGIAADDVDRVFDLFFTTKPRGRGSGLGLPMSREIARDHGGDITIDSTFGEGTRVALWLPA